MQSGLQAIHKEVIYMDDHKYDGSSPAQCKLYAVTPSHGLYETVKNYQDISEKKTVRYRSVQLNA